MPAGRLVNSRMVRQVKFRKIDGRIVVADQQRGIVFGPGAFNVCRVIRPAFRPVHRLVDEREVDEICQMQSHGHQAAENQSRIGAKRQPG